MKDEKKVPAIRFKGFTDAWEQRELSRLAQRIVRKNNNLTTNLPLTISAEYGLVDQITYFNNRVASANLKNYYLIFNGEFAYNKSSSEGNPVGVIKRLDLYKNGALSTLYIIFSIKETSIINSDFLCIFFETSLWHKDIFDRAAEGARNHGLLNISAQDFLEMNIKFPQNLQEQIKIKSLLNKLNTLITLHQRKYDCLVKLKKSLLEKMFPKNGSDKPDIRFKGFTDAWEQRKFSELYKKVSEKNDLSYDVDKIISVANMYFKQESYISNKEYLLTYNIFLVGDIAFEGNRSKNFSYGRFVENTIGNGIVSHVFDVFRPLNEYDLCYWKYAINNENIMKNILARCTKSSTMMTNLVANDFLKETIKVPVLNEQKQIGQLFSKIEQLLTLHQRKLEILQNLKKSLLEKMFV